MDREENVIIEETSATVTIPGGGYGDGGADGKGVGGMDTEGNEERGSSVEVGLGGRLGGGPGWRKVWRRRGWRRRGKGEGEEAVVEVVVVVEVAVGEEVAVVAVVVVAKAVVAKVVEVKGVEAKGAEAKAVEVKGWWRRGWWRRRWWSRVYNHFSLYITCWDTGAPLESDSPANIVLTNIESTQIKCAGIVVAAHLCVMRCPRKKAWSRYCAQ
ncbi:hypothetical protein CYMTET_5167 [Cymbomonas tetramitiformis]|uniref:Uncharacterized protein n=1 Tax=Cymbomonas tetramitiformis TaxID=36881 RepID=A0AAE0GZN7_9CHLO|nr:hypothetical protein CYMTET_5167 [Cymbomonas tetramitiformis]